jgi:hypothetical protein
MKKLRASTIIRLVGHVGGRLPIISCWLLGLNRFTCCRKSHLINSFCSTTASTRVQSPCTYHIRSGIGLSRFVRASRRFESIDVCVQFYPLWLAPNVLTFVGALFVMSGLLLVSIYDYDLHSASPSHGGVPVPDWIWLYCAVCTFLGHHLGESRPEGGRAHARPDGTDGKQARRTGTSGPTGEMFDHGLDSWATVPFTLTLFSAFGRDEYRYVGITPTRATPECAAYRRYDCYSCSSPYSWCFLLRTGRSTIRA